MKPFIKAILAFFLSASLVHAQVVQPISNGKLINTLDGNSQDIKSLDQIGVGNTTVPTSRIHLFPGGTPTAASDGIWIGSDVKLYRNAAASLTLDGNLVVTGTIAGAGNVVTLDGNNTWTGTELFNGAVTVAGNLTLNSTTVTIAAPTVTAMRSALGLVPGVNVQGYDADLNTIAGFTPGVDNFIGSVGGVWALRSASQVRTSLVLGAADTVSFGATTLGSLAVTGTSALTGNVTTGGTLAVNGLVISNSAGTLLHSAPISTSGNITFINNSSLNWSDVNLYRNGANQLKTDDAFIAASITLTGGVGIDVGSGGTGLTSVALNHMLVGAGGGSALTTIPTTTYAQGLLSQGTAANFLTAIHANAYNLAGDLTGSTLINPQIASGAVTTTEIANGTIATADIGALQITSALIGNAAVTGTQLEVIGGGFSPGTYGNVNGLVIPKFTVDANGRLTAAQDVALSTNVIQTTTNATGDLLGSTYSLPTIAPSVITGTKILDGTITGADISSASALTAASLTLSGAAVLNGTVTLGDNVGDAIAITGFATFATNTIVLGDFSAGDPIQANAPFFVDNTTDTVRIGLNNADVLTVNATSNFVSDFAINTNKVNITAATGNAVFGGTLSSTGNFGVSTMATINATTGAALFNGAITGNSSASLALGAFTVAAGTGNTVIGGTLAVTGVTTHTGNIAGTSATFSTTVDATGVVVARAGMSGLRPSDKRIYVAPGAQRASDTRIEAGGASIHKYDMSVPFATYAAAYSLASTGDTIVLQQGTYASVGMGVNPVDIEIGSGAIVQVLTINPTTSATIQISGAGIIQNDAATTALIINQAASSVHIRVPVRSGGAAINASGLVDVQSGTAWFHSNILSTYNAAPVASTLLNTGNSTIVHMLPGSSAIKMTDTDLTVTVAAAATSFFIHNGASVRGTMAVGDYTKLFTGERRPATGYVTATNSVADLLVAATPFTAVFDTEEEDADGISDNATGYITPKLKEDYVLNAGIPVTIAGTASVEELRLKLELEIDADGAGGGAPVLVLLDQFFATDMTNVVVHTAQLNGNYRVKPTTANTTTYRLIVTYTVVAGAPVVNLDLGAFVQITPVR